LKTASPPIWRIELITSAAAQPTLSDALEESCEALSAFEISPRGDWRIEGLTTVEPDRKAITRMLSAAAAQTGILAPEPKIEKLPDTDWLAANRRSFPPLRLGRYFVYGSHYTGATPPGAIPIRLDASLAFGSGEHATTRGCLLALERIAKRRRFPRTLDLGCGSGILAIATAKTHPSKIVAADNDRDSVRLAGENIDDNGVSKRNCRALWSDGFSRLGRRRYDLVFANILAKPLRHLSCRLSRAVRRGGVLVLSGLLSSQAGDVIAAYRLQRLALLSRLTINGWDTLVFARKA
jgi:ribosomal protein L11 methyltransferase